MHIPTSFFTIRNTEISVQKKQTQSPLSIVPSFP